jgi:hypothetical protein
MKMEKNITVLILVFLFISCEKQGECIESFGATVSREVEVEAFRNLKIYKGIEVFITQGDDYKVEIQAGENFIDNIEVTQIGDQLIFRDNTSCNWVRDYGQTKIYVTTPTLENVYSKSDRNITSTNVLTFPILRLIALDKDGDGESGAGTGDFHINIDNSQLVIQNNNVSRYYISGKTDEALLDFYFGDGRIEAQDLFAKNIKVFHRGSNDMIVHPTEKITGKLLSTGNVVLKNVPPIIEMEELFQGNVIYP